MNPIIRSAHTLRFRVAALVGGLCLVLASCQHSPTPPKDQKLYYLATGSPSGTYLLLGAAIAAETPATHLMPCTTAGSKENLELLRQGTVQFALVQMDSLHEELFGDAGESIRPERPNSQGQKNDAQDGTNQIEPSPISLMTFLYSEKVHLFVRPHYYLNSLSDLRRIRSSKDRRSKVWLGPLNSGSHDTASSILEAAGYSGDEIKDFDPVSEVQKEGSQITSTKDQDDLNWDTARDRLLEPALKSSALYAYFRTMAVPRPYQKVNEPGNPEIGSFQPCPGSRPPAGQIQTPATLPAEQVARMLDRDVQIMALPPMIIDRLTEDNFYVSTNIELGSYRGMKRGARTVGVPTVLVTNLSARYDDLVKTLIQGIQNRKQSIEDRIGGIELDQLGARIQHTGLLNRIHDGARNHLEPRSSKRVWLGFLGLTGGVFLAMFLRNSQWLRHKLAAGSYFFLLLAIMGTTWVFLCLAMMQTEGRLNPDFVSVPDAMFNTFRVVSGQVREYRMMTHQGEVLLWLALFLLPLLFGWLTSDVAKDLLRSASVRLGRAIQRAQARDAYRGLIMFAKTPKRIIDWILRKQKGTKGPLIFLNWNERAEHMVNELRKDGKFADRRIIVVLPDASPLRSSAKIVGVDVVDGDPAARLTMERAGIVGAAAVTIVSSWSPADPHDRRRRLDPDAADTKTMLAILTIRSLCEEMHRTSVLQITAEIRLSRFEQEVKNAAHSEIMELTCLPV